MDGILCHTMGRKFVRLPRLIHSKDETVRRGLTAWICGICIQSRCRSRGWSQSDGRPCFSVEEAAQVGPAVLPYIGVICFSAKVPPVGERVAFGVYGCEIGLDGVTGRQNRPGSGALDVGRLGRQILGELAAPVFLQSVQGGCSASVIAEERVPGIGGVGRWAPEERIAAEVLRIGENDGFVYFVVPFGFAIGVGFDGGTPRCCVDCPWTDGARLVRT